MSRWWTWRSSLSTGQGVTVTEPCIEEWIPHT
jgi:hypothetical protein